MVRHVAIPSASLEDRTETLGCNVECVLQPFASPVIWSRGRRGTGSGPRRTDDAHIRPQDPVPRYNLVSAGNTRHRRIQSNQGI